MELDSTDKQLLDILQQGFPLVAEPFRELGQRLGIGTQEALRRVKDLKARRIIRETGGIFDSRVLG